jgi:hypothetical protein
MDIFRPSLSFSAVDGSVAPYSVLHNNVRREIHHMLQAVRIRILLACVLVAFSVILTGCGEEKLDTSYVEGVVTLNDKPVEGAKVFFSPVDPQVGISATGKTDAAGKYTCCFTFTPSISLLSARRKSSRFRRPPISSRNWECRFSDVRSIVIFPTSRGETPLGARAASAKSTTR